MIGVYSWYMRQNELEALSPMEEEEELNEEEKEVIDFISTVSARSAEFDGMCGEIVSVEFKDTADTNEEIREAVRKLSSVTSRVEDEVVDTRLAENIIDVQDTLREVTGIKPKEKELIVVSVQLPDGRIFHQHFDPPTFDSERRSNEFLSLYKDILGLDEYRREGLVGEIVPVCEIDCETDSSIYKIDTNYNNSIEKETDSRLDLGSTVLAKSFSLEPLVLILYTFFYAGAIFSIISLISSTGYM
jgi:hypothetical protein